jgi:very-short-patch-repair endonuclease
MRGHKDRLPEHIVKLCRDFRKNPTPAEEMLWQCLRRRQLHGMRFRRQHPIGRYVADFYCHQQKLIVEVDGCIHSLEDKRQMDKERSSVLEAGGYTILRVKNEEVRRATEAVLLRILAVCTPSPPTPLPRGEGRDKQSR